MTDNTSGKTNTEPVDLDQLIECEDSALSHRDKRVLERLPLPAYHGDNQFYRIVALFLGATVVLCVIGAIYLAYAEKDIPDALVALGSAAVGALAGLFAPSQR